MIEKLIGDTIKVTWVSSGDVPSPILALIYTSSETLVSSVSMTSSGNGHYYSNYTIPNTPGFYVAETLATLDSLPYKRRVAFKAVTQEVDT